MSTNSLCQYLRKLRKSFNYSQGFVASHLNITRQTYSHYETGRITPPTNSLYNLSKLYGIAVEDLLMLAVTYTINDDSIKKQTEIIPLNSDDISNFLEYINNAENNTRLKQLGRQEKLLLYYYSHLDTRDQEDIITFMKLKSDKKRV